MPGKAGAPASLTPVHLCALRRTCARKWTDADAFFWARSLHARTRALWRSLRHWYESMSLGHCALGFEESVIVNDQLSAKPIIGLIGTTDH